MKVRRVIIAAAETAIVAIPHYQRQNQQKLIPGGCAKIGEDECVLGSHRTDIP